MEKTRITMIVSSLLCGGVERVVSMMANYWASHGHSVTVISFDTGSNDPFYELAPEVSHVRLMDPAPNSLYGKAKRLISRIKTLRLAIHRSKPDVTISHGEFINILSGLACSGSKTPLIVAEHSVPDNEAISFGMRLVRNIAYFGARSVVVLNEETAKFFARWAQGRITIIPNALSPIPPSLAISPQSSRPKLILGMGRLSREKGFDQLIRAFAEIKDKSWKMTIWGEGPARLELENLVGALELDERVKLPGLTKSPYNELIKGAIFTLPSRVEGFGNVLCEAMAAGCAVISFDCPTGPRSIISNEENGALISAGDIQALTAGLDRLIDDEALRQKLADGGQKRAVEYSQENVMAKWEKLITSAISKNS